MYLHSLIFAVVDAFFEIDISATYFSLNLQILFNLPVMYNCIYILPFLKPEDASFVNFASTSHVFDNVRMLLIKILYLQSPKISCRRCLPPPKNILCVLFTSQLEPIHYLEKIDIRNSSEYGVSVGDT